MMDNALFWFCILYVPLGVVYLILGYQFKRRMHVK